MAIKQLILAGFFGMFLINMTFCPNVIGAENNIEQSVNQNRLHPRIVQLEDMIGMTSPVKKRVEIVSPKSIFIDVTFSSGIKFEHTDGNSKLRLFNEFLGSGGGFFDYDNDGDLDIYLVNGAYQVGEEAGKSVLNILYRNNGDGTFFDVTDTTNVGDTGYGVGCTIGDYDNDGNVDLYITNFGSNICYRNNGDGTFTDVSTQAGIANKQWGTSCAFVDLNNDGSLDLYITNYADYDLERDRRCEIGGVWVYCGPRSYPPDVDVCYRNNGNGTFTDFSQQSGILNVAAGHGLGVTFGDYDNDGDSDLYVANDRDPNFLFYNQGGGVFEEVALMLGVAYNDMGDEEAGMGTAFGDYNNDGFLDLTVSNFQNETNTVYRNGNGEFFEDATTTAGIAEVTHNFLGWGINFFDYDNDGYKDIFVANGHVMDNINQVNKHVMFPQKNLLFRNLSDGTFRNISDHSGLALEKVSRAVAFGDYDNDGDIDILVTNWNQTPDLLRNDVGNQKNWIQINAVGIKSNRSAIGARAKIVAGNLIQYQEVNSSNGYLSFSDLRLHFGLGSFQRVDTLEIRWPSGRIDKSVNLEVNQRYIATEGIGVQVY